MSNKHFSNGMSEIIVSIIISNESQLVRYIREKNLHNRFDCLCRARTLCITINILPQLPLASSKPKLIGEQKNDTAREKKNESNHNAFNRFKNERRKSLFPWIQSTNWTQFNGNANGAAVFSMMPQQFYMKINFVLGDEQSEPNSNKLSSYPVQFVMRSVQNEWSLCALLPVYYSSSTPIDDTRLIPKNNRQREWQWSKKENKRRENERE